MIIQQLKDLKDLEETGVLDAEEFQAQKKKLANELLSL
jgi:predicted Zn-dependent peptidase